MAILNKPLLDWESDRTVNSERGKVARYWDIYFFIPSFEHGRAIEDETKSGEVRKNRVRDSDGRNDSELRITQLDQ